MKKIYVLLMHTNTIPSKLVKLFTNYEYSHVAISLDKNCDTIYSFGRKKIKSILNGGFTAECKTGEFFKVFNKTQCKIFEITVTDKQYNDAKKIITSMKKNSQIYKYDFLGIIFRFFKIPVTFRNKYVCSYFVAYVLEKAKIYSFNKKVCLIKPKDFESLEGFKEIYSGRYCEYT